MYVFKNSILNDGLSCRTELILLVNIYELLHAVFTHVETEHDIIKIN